MNYIYILITNQNSDFLLENNPCLIPIGKPVTDNKGWGNVCDGGVAIDVTGGCFAQLAKDGETYTSVFEPGFSAIQGKFETINGAQMDIGARGFNEVKLTCHSQ